MIAWLNGLGASCPGCILLGITYDEAANLATPTTYTTIRTVTGAMQTGLQGLGSRDPTTFHDLRWPSMTFDGRCSTRG